MATIIQATLATTRPSCDHRVLEDFGRAYQAHYGVPCPVAVALVTMDVNGRDRTLVIDHDWIELARTARDIDPSLIDDLDVPPEAVLAMVPGAPDDWSDSFDHRNFDWCLSSDGVMVLVPEGPMA